MTARAQALGFAFADGQNRLGAKRYTSTMNSVVTTIRSMARKAKAVMEGSDGRGYPVVKQDRRQDGGSPAAVG